MLWKQTLSVLDRSRRPPGHPSLHPSINPYTMNKRTSLAAVICMGTLTWFGTPVRAADTCAADCFKPFNPQTKMLQFKAKKPPYRVALANGYIGNTWRIEMIKCLEAYAQDPEIKPLIKELKIVSTGTDVAAQIGAVDNFINAGYDVVLINAVSPTAFKPVILDLEANGQQRKHRRGPRRRWQSR